jgi:hypothetical protein
MRATHDPSVHAGLSHHAVLTVRPTPPLPSATPAIETPSIAPANFRLAIIAAPYVKPQLSVFRR